ncbi:hypothetical protein Sjap_008889 [Stephania japonica]|uniref:Uncharacterized protein n=1 Tax=Stephania japonica TaxID=461633 RepID=A0AAP0PF33_9MAGN
MTVKVPRLVESSASLMLTMEGLKEPIEMQMREVPHSLDSWSHALGIGVVKSPVSLVDTDKSVNVNEFKTKGSTWYPWLPLTNRIIDITKHEYKAHQTSVVMKLLMFFLAKCKGSRLSIDSGNKFHGNLCILLKLKRRTICQAVEYGIEE